MKVDYTKWKEHLHGGKSDGHKPDEYDPNELSVGQKVQKEHTNDSDTATQISMDHEQENPTYYDELVMSGIADEKDALDTYDKVKTDEEKKKAIDKIQSHLDKEKAKLKENHIITKFQDFIK